MKAWVFLIVLAVYCTLHTATAEALTISPTKLEVAGDPGQTIIGEIELFNEQSETKTFYTSFENFEPRGETGAPYFVGGGKGLATWLGAQNSITVEPGARVAMPYTLTIPADATPGGYFAAVFFGSQGSGNGASGSDVAIGGKVGTLVLLRVNGEVSESGGLLEFGEYAGAHFLSHVPVTYTYRFNNTGGDRVVPRGSLTITNMFGQTVDTLPANATEGSVLPASIRKFEVVWGESDTISPVGFWQTARYQLSHFRMGLYKAVLDVSWGESAQTGTSVSRIFIFPWQLILVSLGGLFAFFTVLKFYNRMIVARSTRSR